ncbi:putative RND efflux pump, membrane fusion protein, Similar to AcrA family [Candidatus Methylobacter favarea]|uniref:Putative RND efflux pump, membrane fusion protein, Similar to AcrA family n=1 Tax=Candidatus Methylobacter favarea TaxID=2707345 RepID=A0A8S0Y8U3_9GAMM|nr:efflux RND transporter periplasmic adaptor subunit [Candidatus Methylobacter favarea]CAA9889296.1 putative RND efflux pump, membrane fusion protein, Similar to AcrA family [Candidatus Methylobacter favarea]
MKFNSKNTIVLVALLAVVMVSSLLYWRLKPHDASGPDTPVSEPEPVAQVQTIKLHKGEFNETFTAYGVVLPFPDKLMTISVPYISQIDKMQVNQGQIVRQGDVLLTLKPGVSAVLQLEQARRELGAALRDNELLQERIRLKLATRQNSVATQLRVEQARVMVKNLLDQGIGKERQIRAEQDGIIYLVSVQQGQIVAAGAPLLQLADQNQWMVRLGVEPEDYAHLQPGQQVLIRSVNTPAAEPVEGRIEIITHQIDPNTRLLNVFVRPALNQILLINDFVEGRIVIASADTFSVPRQAVLPDEGGYNLFTVANGRAVKHRVEIGLENDRQVEVIAADLKAGDDVAVLGNYELEPGMAVSAAPANHNGKGAAQ